MGYYMRYFSTDEQEITIYLLESALKQFDPQYAITNGHLPPRGFGDLMYGNEIYGQIEVNRVGDRLFQEELDEFKEFLNGNRSRGAKTVLQVLNNAKTTVAIQVLWQDRTVAQTLNRIDPLYKWLFANRKGLLQVDGEGYYNGSKLILKEE